jgi:HAD superfamily hydrolase (TIGR01450 family)
LSHSKPQYAGYILDLDGTVYRGDQLISGAQERIAWIREAGSRIVFLSNKPLEPRASYAAKLTRLGIPTPCEDVINSTQALFYHLRQENQREHLYVIGESTLLREFQAEGFLLTNNLPDIRIVIAAFDRTLDYAKLDLAHQALIRGARFYATNSDRTCPMAEGELPDCAGVIAFLEATTGRKVEFIAGKPSAGILIAALAHLNLPREQCLMVGDRLATDIQMGVSFGIDTALVLTGVTSRESLAASDLQPTFILESISNVP